jgi:HEAT repeat protein
MDSQNDDLSAIGASLHDFLAQSVSALEAWIFQLVNRAAVPPNQPYRFLYPFETEDAAHFHGRDAAVEALYQAVLHDRLTVLHGRSGIGKTSLLNAGLIPRMIHDGRLPLYARAYDDPVHFVKCAVAPPALEPWPESLFSLSLHEFLGLVCAHLGHGTQELVVILDQFEEFLAFWPTREQRRPFIDALAKCSEDTALPLRLVISLRSGYYADLAKFQGQIPTIFSNTYRLAALTRQEALLAITEPVDNVAGPVAYAPALLDVLLDDLSGGGPVLYRSLSLGSARGGTIEGIEPVHIQIVCTRLFEGLDETETAESGESTAPANSTSDGDEAIEAFGSAAVVDTESVISLAAYHRMGGAQRLLETYLYDVLDRLPERDAVVARQVLKELVSSQGTKRVLSAEALAARVGVEGAHLTAVLSLLMGPRLVRQQDFAGQVRYELAHEYLIEDLREWFDLSELESKQAEELLMQEVAIYRVLGSAVPQGRLRALGGHRERFRGLDERAWEHLLRVVLETEFPGEDWVAIAGEISEKLLVASLADSRDDIRRAALRRLGVMWELPAVSQLADEDVEAREAAARALEDLGDQRAVQPLITALQDENSVMRQLAAERLGELGDAEAVGPLIIALRDEEGAVRWRAVEALGKIGDYRAIESLIGALQDEDSAVRWSAAWALCELGGPVVEPLTVALQDGSSAIRQSVARSLGMIGDPRAVEALIAALQDQDSSVRRLAAWALHQIDDPRAVQPLIAALRDEDEDVRWSALEALVNIRVS